MSPGWRPYSNSALSDDKAGNLVMLGGLELGFLIIDRGGNIQCVGEAKTVWNHELSEASSGLTYSMQSQNWLGD
jgi:hypothetical protein